MTDSAQLPSIGLNTQQDDLGWTRYASIVFVVGAPRSGTTWLQAMLGAHPSVATGPETHFFKAFSGVGELYEERLPRLVGLREYLEPTEFYATLGDLFHRVASKIPEPAGPSRIFLEKTPEHCHHTELILRCLPEARFIHLLRDGRHAIASLMRVDRNWSTNADSPYQIATVASKVWRRSVEASRSIPRLLGNRDAYREVRYEDLIRNPGPVLGDLFAWMSVPHEEDAITGIVESCRLEQAKSKNGFASISVPRGATQAGRSRSRPSSSAGRGPARKTRKSTRFSAIRSSVNAGRCSTSLVTPTHGSEFRGGLGSLAHGSCEASSG